MSENVVKRTRSKFPNLSDEVIEQKKSQLRAALEVSKKVGKGRSQANSFLWKIKEELRAYREAKIPYSRISSDIKSVYGANIHAIKIAEFCKEHLK